MIDGIGQSDMLGKLEHGGDTSVVDGLSSFTAPRRNIVHFCVRELGQPRRG